MLNTGYPYTKDIYINSAQRHNIQEIVIALGLQLAVKCNE